MVARMLRLFVAALALSVAAASVEAQDGRLVFVRGVYPNTDLYTSRPDGSDLQVLVALPGYQFGPRWSPDGRAIAFGSTHEATYGLYVINADGTQLRRVTNQTMTSTHGPWGITWSPDGTKLVYGQWITYSYAVLRQVNLDGSGWGTVVDIGGESCWPDVSGVHGRLLFSRQNGSWSPSEQLYMTSGANIGPPFTSIFPDDGCVRMGRWSPVGDRIVLIHSPGVWYYEKMDVFTINPDGSGRERLTNDNVEDAEPCFSPDGSKIVWRRLTSSGTFGLWVMNADGTDKRVIVGLEECAEPDWTAIDARDSIAPITEATAVPAPNAAGWNTTDVLVELSATDEGSGVAATYYSLDGNPPQAFLPPIVPVQGDGDHTLAYWSVDAAGNVEAPKLLTLKIDTACTFTQATISLPSGPACWYLSPVTVTLSPQDGGSGVAATFYAIGDGDPQIYSEPIPLTTDGTYSIRFWSTDVAGNVEAEQTVVVPLDTTAPVTTCNASPEPNGAGWNNTDVLLELSASDACSGVERTYYQVDGTEVIIYDAGILVAGEGEHTVTFWSVDVAGNVEAPQTRTVRIDKTAPTITIAEPTNRVYALNEVVTAQYAATDDLSGLISCTGTVANGALIDTNNPGTKTFAVTATDTAGNTSVTTVTYTVSYRVVPLYDQEKAHKSGSTVPIKVRIEDAAGANLSSPGLAVRAVQVFWVDGSTTGTPEDSGNANPDGNFRYTNGMYVFNLSTKGYRAGTWELRLTVAGDPTVHVVRFRIR